MDDDIVLDFLIEGGEIAPILKLPGRLESYARRCGPSSRG